MPKLRRDPELAKKAELREEALRKATQANAEGKSLESLSARIRADNGIEPELLRVRYPVYPFDTPGIPPVGPDFQRVAAQLAPTPENGVVDEELRTRYMFGLLTFALYDRNFQMPVMTKNRPIPVPFISGHIWQSTPDEEEDGSTYGPLVESDVMVIGKMPGETANERGRHLSGASGDVIRQALADVSFYDYGRWYVSTLIKHPIPIPSLGKSIAASWLKNCAWLLEQELRLVRPKFVLCLGSDAGQYFLGTEGKVSSAANRVFDGSVALNETESHRFKLMVSLNPAAVARDPAQYDQFRESIRAFTQLVRGEYMGDTDEKFDITVIKNEEEAEQLVQMLEKRFVASDVAWPIAIDAEWHKERYFEKGAFLRTVQIAWSPTEAAVFMLNDVDGKPVFSPNPKMVGKILQRIFKCTAERKVRLVTHFGRADLPWITDLGFDDMLAHMTPPDDTPEEPGFVRYQREGGFDTGLAAHAVNETDDFKLELQASRYAGMLRWDGELLRWKETYCADNGLESGELEGYGPCPDNILVPYGAKDAIGTWRLFEYYLKKLTADANDQDSWFPFWVAGRAVPACAEIENTGLLLDQDRIAAQTTLYMTKKAQLISQLRSDVNWATFNPSSVQQCKELLFGVGFSGKVDKASGNMNARVSPPEALLCNLEPIKSSSKATKKSWAELKRSGEVINHSPGTDKEVLGILALVSPIAKQMRNLRFISQLLNTTLKPPAVDKKTLATILDEDGDPLYEKGLRSWLCYDGRIRTNIRQVLDTGRWASRRPNLQNIGKRREADYQRMLGADYLAPLRDMFVAAPGCALIEADYIGAELAIMAWQSQDPLMIEHIRRAGLDESDPNFYDIHSSVAVSAFRLTVPNAEASAKLGVPVGGICPATKKALELCGYSHLRVAAKNVVFGYAYGRGAEAIQRQCKEESKPGEPEVTIEQAQGLINGLIEMYPGLPIYFDACRWRVTKPGWTRSCMGRLRRCRASEDRKVQGELERQFMNFGIQSAVADAMNRAVDHLYTYRMVNPLTYRIALQIHDAVILEVPYEHVEAVMDVVLPECMTNRVDIWPADLDGMPLPYIKEPYHLGTDRHVYLRWGQDLSYADCDRTGINRKFGKAPKVKK